MGFGAIAGAAGYALACLHTPKPLELGTSGALGLAFTASAPGICFPKRLGSLGLHQHACVEHSPGAPECHARAAPADDALG